MDMLNSNQIIIILSILSMLIIIGLLWKNSKSYLVDILPTIGIIGTFLGIVYALWSLDTNHIQESIPTLLDGMKIAFISSLVALTLSAFIKVHLIYQDKSNDSHEDVSKFYNSYWVRPLENERPVAASSVEGGCYW